MLLITTYDLTLVQFHLPRTTCNGRGCICTVSSPLRFNNPNKQDQQPASVKHAGLQWYPFSWPFPQQPFAGIFVCCFLDVEDDGSSHFASQHLVPPCLCSAINGHTSSHTLISMCHQDFTPCLSTADVVRQYCRSYTPFYLLDRPDDGAGSKLGIMVNSPGFPCLAESLYKSPKSFSYTSFPHWNIFTRPALYSLYSAQNGYTYSTMTLRSSHLQRLSYLLLPRPRC